jgi:lysophospholipase L1-like esterase
MVSRHTASGESAAHSYKHIHPVNLTYRQSRHISKLLALLLCLLLVLVGCAQSDVRQPGTTGQTSTKAKTTTPITYVAIGASDAFGIGTSDPYDDNWANDLDILLGPSHVHLINTGIPGITIHDVLNIELPIAVDAHPDLVTIWLGVNDIVANVPVSSYAADLNTLFRSLRASSPHARIAIANLPDLTLLPYFSSTDPQKLHAQVRAYNAAISTAAQQYHAILVDLTQESFNIQTHPEYISSDGLHPTSIGYQQLANLFYAALSAAQKQA